MYAVGICEGRGERALDVGGLVLVGCEVHGR